MSKYFYVFGNPISTKIFLFEKFYIFYKFTIKQLLQPIKFYSICSVGFPSKSCLEYLRSFKNKQIFYFGDLDPESLYCYLTFVFGNRNFTKSRRKFNIKFAGLTVEDYKKFLIRENVLIKINPTEKRVLKLINKIKLKEIAEEIQFLNKGYKVEIEAFSKVGFEKYFKLKIKNLLK